MRQEGKTFDELVNKINIPREILETFIPYSLLNREDGEDVSELSFSWNQEKRVKFLFECAERAVNAYSSYMPTAAQMFQTFLEQYRQFIVGDMGRNKFLNIQHELRKKYEIEIEKWEYLLKMQEVNHESSGIMEAAFDCTLGIFDETKSLDRVCGSSAFLFARCVSLQELKKTGETFTEKQEIERREIVDATEGKMQLGMFLAIALE